jgi:hypothetical protein
LRCLAADVALLGAPDTFLDAIRRMIESFESFEQAYTAAAIGCQAVADALQEKPFNPDRAAAALNISKGTMNLPELARVRALEVRVEVQPGWLSGAEVMKLLDAPYWNANFP